MDDALLDFLPEVPSEFEGESSSIARASYDEGTQVLRVTFARKSAEDEVVCYAYAGVPLKLWREFYQAPSRGKFFQTQIRPMFAGSPCK